MADTLENVVLSIVQTGRDRCGIGFGKYPLGIREAVAQLLPLVDQSAKGRDGRTIAEKVADFDERLSRG